MARPEDIEMTNKATEQGRTRHVDSNRQSQSSELHRGLKARQVTMIALGGAIGTGLIIETGNALSKGGPGSLFIAYSLVGFVVWLVMTALGEMAVWLPISTGFSGYATRFCDPALGFALGWTYWIKYIIIVPNQLTAASMVIQYWVKREKVNPGVFITVFLVAIVFINYFGVKYFGEFEFCLSSIKVLTLCGLILLSLTLALGGGPHHDATGFRYWKDPGAFKPWTGSTVGNLDTAKFVAFWSVLGSAVFAYLGTELIGVTVGEAQNPSKTIPRAIKLTFFRIFFFYCLSVLFLGMITPYDYRTNPDPSWQDSDQKAKRAEDRQDATASPFVAAIRHAKIQTLPGFLNACILLFVFSASTSDLYIASRTIYGLALQGQAPSILKRTNSRGIPIYSLGLSSFFACVAYVNTVQSSKKVFTSLVTIVSSFGLLAWISILVSHICFVRARQAQHIQVLYRAPLGIWGSYFALFFCCTIALTKSLPGFIVNENQTEINRIKKFDNFTQIQEDNLLRDGALVVKFDGVNFVIGYISIPIYLITLFGYKFWARTKTVNRFDADLLSGKEEIDRQEKKFLEATESEPVTKRSKFHKRFVGWLF